MSALTWVSEGGRRLDSEISARAGVSRAAAQKWLDAGLVLVDGQARPKNHQTRQGEVVTVTPPPARPLDAQPEDIPLCIVYEDDALLVVDKPRGMVVHPAAGNEQGTLVNALLAHCGSSLSGINGVLRPGIVHRIDKDTSGLLVVAKTDAAHLGLSAQLEAHSMEREYRAVVHGRMRESEGVIDAPLARHPVHRKKMAVVPGGRRAVTHYRVLEQFPRFCYLSCRLETGRTHQIRVHMASIGHPLAGDPLYGPARGLSIGGQCLHAAVLGFTHPVTGEFLRFVSPLPDYFEALLKKLPTL
ncbi:MAG TPA: RluA family pseudouridine synthase [Candidatus Galloscillospira excrementipullorum]|nr:RluA family pseudouridine synthase [Candidatus Galloscillospira excrementipullorum]